MVAHLGCRQRRDAIVAGVVSANRFKSWLSAGKRDGVLTMRLHQIGRDEAIELAPEAELRGEPFFIQAGELEETLQRYAGYLLAKRYRSPSSTERLELLVPALG